MRDKYLEKLEELHQLLIEMGVLCEEVIDATFEALMNEDRAKAEEIREKDLSIDQMEKEIESKCLKLLLRQQPVASDLRKISAALKMITDMERIGDQASDIAEILLTGSLAAPAQDIRIGEMAKATMKMVRESVDSYVKEDLELARKVIDSDDIVDDLFREIRGKLADGLMSKEATKDQILDLLMVAKYYERIGDHATNIAEWVEYSITGIHRNDEMKNR